MTGSTLLHGLYVWSFHGAAQGTFTLTREPPGTTKFSPTPLDGGVDRPGIRCGRAATAQDRDAGQQYGRSKLCPVHHVAPFSEFGAERDAAHENVSI